MSSTHREYVGDGYSVCVQHCEAEGCDAYLGVNYPAEFCAVHTVVVTADRTRRLALTITTTVCLLALIATFNNPVAFTVALVGSLWIGSVAYAIDVRARLAASEAECEQLARVAKAAIAEGLQLDQENMRLHLELSEAQLLAGTGRVPLLRVVPNGGQS